MSVAASDLATRLRGRELLRAIAEGTAGAVGEQFLRGLVRTVAEAFGAKLAFVAEAPGELAKARRLCGPLVPVFTHSVFYRYTAPSDQLVLVAAQQSNYIVGILVARGFPPNGCVATVRDVGVFKARAAQTYTLGVADLLSSRRFSGCLSSRGRTSVSECG